MCVVVVVNRDYVDSNDNGGGGVTAPHVDPP